jgi:7-carboxy-7-deazaguanine synthase
MIVNEIFYSLQGEGLLAGVPSVFIRLAGCPLRCWWCDTKYAWDYNSGRELSIGKIISQVRKFNCRFVVITGGEPLAGSDLKIRKDLPELLDALKKIKKHITIETSGIIFVPDLSCDLMSISPKLSNSLDKKTKLDSRSLDYARDRFRGNDKQLDDVICQNVSVLKKLIKHYNYQLKFVVDNPDDIFEILDMIKVIGPVQKEKVLLMPQARTRKEFFLKTQMVARLCLRTGLTFSTRLHILLWNGKRGV